MRICITGGAGFIGTALSRSLLYKGHDLTILDSFNPQIHGNVLELPADLRPHLRLFREDVREAGIWEKVVPGHQAIVHLAAETGTGQSMYEVSRYEQVNLAGTANLYHFLANNSAHQVERIVVASSRAIYGEGAYRCSADGVVYPAPRPVADKSQGQFDPVCPLCGGSCVSIPTPESAPFQPASFYGLTKQVQEQITLLFSDVLGIPSVALRYQNVYGPGQSLKNPYTGILAVFSNLAREGKSINVFEDGKESRDFVYIDDVVRATIAAIELESKDSHVVNVGSGIGTAVIDVARSICEFFQRGSHVAVSGDFRKGDIRHGAADLGIATKLLNFRPEVTFQQGLRAFLEWASERDHSEENYLHSLEEMRERKMFYSPAETGD